MHKRIAFRVTGLLKQLPILHKGCIDYDNAKIQANLGETSWIRLK